MLSFFHRFSKPPSLKKLPLKRYPIVDFSLNRLVAGVDNIHFDVHISPQVQNAIRRTAYLLMIKHSGSESFFQDYRKEHCENEKKALKQLCADMLMEGINRAKSEAEVQIDFLGQAALAKMFLEEIKHQYGLLTKNFADLFRTYELSYECDQFDCFKMKEKLAEIKRHQQRIVRLVGEELFQLLADIQVKGLLDIRQAIFPPESILPGNFHLNPMLHTDNVADDTFLMEAYVLLSQRAEDPDNYNSLKLIIYDLLGKTDFGREITTEGGANNKNTSGGPEEEDLLNAVGGALDPWIMDVDNIDRLFNCFDSQEQFARAKRKKESRDVLLELKGQMRMQLLLLNLFYRRFKEAQLMKRIMAAYEIKTLCGQYCPPLLPWQVREFLVKPAARKPLIRQLKRRKPSSGNSSSLVPLRRTIRRIRLSSSRKKKQYLLGFLKHFSQYHRDLNNGRLLKEAMEAISLVKEEKILLLSRENRSLYEFLLPDERGQEEKPIINHVILKADIRGSMDITYLMRARGLNPASYFSLNFFDPISEILFDYGGCKEFIEGDAIILSIFEKEDTPQGWYSVARACGLAIRMLQIVQQYNVKSQKHNLPILELGIGICYSEGSPAFLFDGDSRIMISPAINLADRLSGCNKMLRKRLQNQERMFNLFVFQNVTEKEMGATADDLFLRYNVNGIELSPEGFAKLARELNLKSLIYPVDNNEKVKLYTGKVPTITGRYQRLAIREAPVLEVDPASMQVIGETARKYYEVCTRPEIYEFIENQN